MKRRSCRPTRRGLGAKTLLDPIRKQADTFGQAANPFSSFLVVRGGRTLPLRSARGSANAAALAAFLEAGSATRDSPRTRITPVPRSHPPPAF